MTTKQISPKVTLLTAAFFLILSLYAGLGFVFPSAALRAFYEEGGGRITSLENTRVDTTLIRLTRSFLALMSLLVGLS